MQHRIVERGEDSNRILLALFPLAMALGLDVFMAIERTFGVGAGVAVGASFFIVAITFWYVLESVIRENKPCGKGTTARGYPFRPRSSRC